MSGDVIIVVCVIAVSALVAGFVIGINVGSWMAKKTHPAPLNPIAHHLLAGFAALALLLSLGCTAYSVYFLTTSTSTSATVIALEERTDKEGHQSSWALYRYTDGSGVQRDGSTSLAERWATPGKEIPIRFSTDAPWRSRLDTFAGHWSAPLLMLFFAVGLFVASLIRKRYYHWKTTGIFQPTSFPSKP